MFDTTGANTAYYNRILKHLGRPELTPDQFAYCHMHTVDNALKFLFEDAGQLEAAHAYKREMGYRDFIPMMEIEPHLKPLLRERPPRKRPAAVSPKLKPPWGVRKFPSISASPSSNSSAQW